MSLTNCLLILWPCSVEIFALNVQSFIISEVWYWCKWSKTNIADVKLFQEQCLKVWQVNSEPLGQ